MHLFQCCPYYKHIHSYVLGSSDFAFAILTGLESQESKIEFMGPQQLMEKRLLFQNCHFGKSCRDL